MADLKVGKMVIGSVQTNCYFVYREGTTEVICVDPGDKGEVIFDKLSAKGMRVAGILLTHGHFDHIMGTKKLRELSKAPIYAYEEEQILLEDAETNVSALAGRPYTVVADFYVKDNEMITIAGITCKLIGTSGHTCGSCCFYFEEDQILISGDTLFEESVGRTDLATGSMSSLKRSIKEKLFVLPEEVVVYPGHGDSTTILHEKQYNPFCQ